MQEPFAAGLWPFTLALALPTLLFLGAAFLPLLCLGGISTTSRDGRMGARCALQMLKLSTGLNWCFVVLGAALAAALFLGLVPLSLTDATPPLPVEQTAPLPADSAAMSSSESATPSESSASSASSAPSSSSDSSPSLSASVSEQTSPSALQTAPAQTPAASTPLSLLASPALCCLLIGGGGLLVVALGGLVLTRLWRASPRPGGLAVLALLSLIAPGSAFGLVAQMSGALRSEPLPLLAGLLVLVLGLACGGGLGLVWLLVRRKADDFGRDYYAFAARRLALRAAVPAWALLPLLAGWLHLVGVLLGPRPDVSALLTRAFGVATDWGTALATLLDPVPAHVPLLAAYPALNGLTAVVGGCLALVFVTALCWTVTARSAVPMRNKLAMTAGLLCLALLIAALGCLAGLLPSGWAL